MSALADHPLLAATAPAVRRELGCTPQDIAAADAKLRCGPDGRSRDALDAHARAVWNACWQQIARRRPGRFAVAPSRLAERDPIVLAFLYARRVHAERALPVFVASDRERALLAASRRALNSQGFSLSPARAFVIDGRLPVLQAVAQHERFVGLSFAQEPALRRHVLLDGDHISDLRRRHQHGAVAQLVLHEQLHATIGVAARARPWTYHDPLVSAVDEAVTTVLELWAAVAAEDPRPTAAKISRRAAGNCYRRQARTVLRLLADGQPDMPLTQATWRLAMENLRYATGRQTAAALDRLAFTRRTPRDWLKKIGEV